MSKFVYLYSSAINYNLQLTDAGVRMAACHARQKLKLSHTINSHSSHLNCWPTDRVPPASHNYSP